MAEDVAFIGLGNMGYQMAGNLRKKIPSSTTLYVNDVDVATCDRFVQEFDSFGPIQVVASAKEAASNAKTVVSMVPAAKHVHSVYLDEKTGVINAPRDSKRLLLECSTIDIDSTKEIGLRIMAAGLGTYVDAPVSGGVQGAAAASLAFMIGYSKLNPRASQPDREPTFTDPVVSRIQSIVTTMGLASRINFCGTLGTGLAAKLANNYLSCCSILIVAEAMAFGLRYNVDQQTLFNCIKGSSGQSWVFENLQPCPGVVESAPSSRGFKPSFRPIMAVKDISLGMAAAKKVGVDAAMGATALKAFKRAEEDPRTKDLDCTAVWYFVNGELN